MSLILIIQYVLYQKKRRLYLVLNKICVFVFYKCLNTKDVPAKFNILYVRLGFNLFI